MINGLFYKKIKVEEEEKQDFVQITKPEFNIGEIVTDSAISIISVGTIIAIFFVIIHSLTPLFNLFPASLSGVFEGQQS